MSATHHRPSAPGPAQPAPGTYVKTGVHGEAMQRTANTATEAVALVFDGWQPQTAASTSAVAAPAGATTKNR